MHLFSFSIILSKSPLLTIVKYLEELAIILFTDIIKLKVDLKQGSSKQGIISLNARGELFKDITKELK